MVTDRKTLGDRTPRYGRAMKKTNPNNYPADMDKQCIPLCDALNAIPGIHTYESCCGHNHHPFWIWFTITGPIQNLTVVGRVFDRRYGAPEGWTCTLDNTDSVTYSPTFWISSNKIWGPKAYRDAKKITNNIYGHLTHKAFIDLFDIQTHGGIPPARRTEIMFLKKALKEAERGQLLLAQELECLRNSTPSSSASQCAFSSAPRSLWTTQSKRT